MILDFSMPVMNGLETLEAIRSSPPHAALPVVMLTAEKDETIVRRLVELGITDYLSKPLSPDVLAARLARIVERVHALPPPMRTADTGGRPRTILVVDQDPDRRHFLRTVLAPHFRVLEADSAASALERAADPTGPDVDVVFTGERIGLPPLDMFARKLRAMTRTASARLVGCAPPGTTAGARSLDAVMEWSYVPAGFLARFERALSGKDVTAGEAPTIVASLARDAVSASEQLFGMLLSSEVSLADAASPMIRPWPGEGVHAAIDMAVEGGPSFTVVFRTDKASAEAVTARLLGVEPADLHEADVLSTISEFVNIIGGRLRNRLTETGSRPGASLPRTWLGDTAAGIQAMADEVTTLSFNSARPPASFEVLLRTRA